MCPSSHFWAELSGCRTSLIYSGFAPTVNSVHLEVRWPSYIYHEMHLANELTARPIWSCSIKNEWLVNRTRNWALPRVSYFLQLCDWNPARRRSPCPESGATEAPIHVANWTGSSRCMGVDGPVPEAGRFLTTETQFFALECCEINYWLSDSHDTMKSSLLHMFTRYTAYNAVYQYA
jgi:hypothetical protein